MGIALSYVMVWYTNATSVSRALEHAFSGKVRDSGFGVMVDECPGTQ